MTHLGNTLLVEYGIQNEQSDIRAHVCVQAQRVYVYPTRQGTATINSGQYPRVPVRTPVGNGKTVITAEGYLVPPAAIPRCVSMPIPDRLLERVSFSASDGTTAKGEKAVRVVKWFLRHGGFPLSVHPEIIQEQDLQVQGLDIVVHLRARIQVKCDYNGGARELGGSGNLFLQVAECNPLKSY